MPKPFSKAAQNAVFANKKQKSALGKVEAVNAFRLPTHNSKVATEPEAPVEVEEARKIDLNYKWPYKNNEYMHLDATSPEKFLEEVAIKIKLDKLYKLKQVAFLDTNFQLVGLILKVKDPVLLEGYSGRRFVLQVWNKQGFKIYQKEFFQPPAMWSSDQYIIFKPSESETSDHALVDSSGEEDRDNERDSVYYSSIKFSRVSEFDKKIEAARDNTLKEFGSTKYFYVVGSWKDSYRVFKVHNWMESQDTRLDVRFVTFGKNIFSVASRKKIFYAYLNTTDARHQTFDIEKDKWHEYNVAKSNQSLEIRVFNATSKTCGPKSETELGAMEADLGLQTPDGQLSFIKVKAKYKVDKTDGDEESRWDCSYKSLTHIVNLGKGVERETRCVFSVNNGRNSFVFHLFERPNSEKRITDLDVYMNGNRISTLDEVVDVGFDDQNLFVSKKEKVSLSFEEFQDRLDEFNRYNLDFGWSPEMIERYMGLKKPIWGEKADADVAYEINLERGSNISWLAAEKSDIRVKDIRQAPLSAALSYGNPFSSLNLVGDSIYVSHSEFVSRYSILQNKWISHMKFPSEVVEVCRTIGDSSKAKLMHSKTQIKDKPQEGGADGEDDEEKRKQAAEEKAKADAERKKAAEKISQGQETEIKQDLLVILDDNTVYKGVISQFKIKKEQVEQKPSQPESRADSPRPFEQAKPESPVKEGSPSKGPRDRYFRDPPNKIIYRPKGNQRIQVSYDPEKAKGQLFFWPGLSADEENLAYLQDGKQIEIEDQPRGESLGYLLVTPVKDQPLVVRQVGKQEVELYSLVSKHQGAAVQFKLVSSAKHPSNLFDLKLLHSACICEEYGEVLLANESSFYNFLIHSLKEETRGLQGLELETKKQEIQKQIEENGLMGRLSQGRLYKSVDHEVKTIFTKDQVHFYAVRRGNMDVPEGLAMYHCKQLFNRKPDEEVRSSFLAACQVGEVAYLDYSQSNTRISYMKNLSAIEIIPLLHENSLSFFSMPERDDLVCLKREHDLVYALTFSSEIYAWEISTGKLKSYQKLTNLDLSKYRHLENSRENLFSQTCFKNSLVILVSNEQVLDKTCTSQTCASGGVDCTCAQYKYLQKFSNSAFTMTYGDQVEGVNRKQVPEIHDMLVLEIENDKKVRVVREFKWPIWSQLCSQQTFISDSEKDDLDGMFLWEKNEGNCCYLYEWQAEQGNGASTKGDFVFRRSLEQFPVKAIPNVPTRSLQSPDLMRYFNPFDMTIRSMLDDEVHVELGANIIENLGWKKATQIANCFNWRNGETFETISMNGIERIFVIVPKKQFEKEKGKFQYELLLYGYTQIPYFDPEETEEYHHFIEPSPLTFNQTFERLTRKYAQHKRASLIHDMKEYYDQEQVKQWIEVAKAHLKDITNKKSNENSGAGAEEADKQENKSLLGPQKSEKKPKTYNISTKDQWPEHHDRQVHMSEFLFEVDTGFAEIEEYGTLVQATLSFTYLDWMAATQIKKGEVDIDDLANAQIRKLLLNIFPDCSTLLHMLADSPHQLKKLIRRIKAMNHESGEPFDFPFVFNLEGETPLHILYNNQDHKNLDSMLQLLSDFGADHHSRYTMDLWAELIESNVPSVVDYLNSRMIDTPYTELIQEGVMEQDSCHVQAEIAFEKSTVEKEAFGQTSEEVREKFEKAALTKKKGQSFQGAMMANVQMQLIDAPELFSMKEETEQFMKALAQTDNFEIFNAEAVKSVINYLYKPIRKWTLIRLFIPYCLFLLIYVLYADVLVANFQQAISDRMATDSDIAITKELLADYADLSGLTPLEKAQAEREKHELETTMSSLLRQQKEDKEHIVNSDAMIVWGQIPLAIFAIYFLLVELFQMKQEQKLVDYFKDVWSYVDLLPPFLVALIILQYHTDLQPQRTSTYEAILLGLCSFVMWLKVLYFMRIFKQFSYLIRMIIKVIEDMIPFLVVLLFAMVAFADAFYAISMANKEPFIDSFVMAIIYIYNMCLGAYENEYGETAPTFAYILFLMCTLFNMIVMFNLLIAIISETFAAVNENAEQAGYQERADLISENLYLIPDYEKHKFQRDHTYLYKIVDTDKEFAKDEEDEQADKINDIYRLVNKLEQRMMVMHGHLKIKKPPKKRKLPKTPEEVVLGDKCEIPQHECVLRKYTGRGSWACDCRHYLESGCMNDYKPYKFYNNGKRMRCSECDFDACFECAQKLIYNEEHRKAREEDKEEVIVE